MMSEALVTSLSNFIPGVTVYTSIPVNDDFIEIHQQMSAHMKRLHLP